MGSNKGHSKGGTLSCSAALIQPQRCQQVALPLSLLCLWGCNSFLALHFPYFRKMKIALP